MLVSRCHPFFKLALIICAIQVVNCSTDFLLALLPAPLIWTLTLNLRTRISLILILSLGVFAGIAGIIRATVFDTILYDPRRFIHVKYSMWNYVELTIGIIAGSLPALKPLFHRLLNVARGTNSGVSAKATGHKGPNSLGYYKQSDQGEAGIGLKDLTGTVRRLSKVLGPSDKAVADVHWTAGRGADSEESILRLHGSENTSKSIVVTRDYHVE
jgi:hypothetical protein